MSSRESEVERWDEMGSGGERGEALEGDEKEGSKIKH